MCCIFGCIKWSISCLHRSLTCVLGFLVMLTIMYALALCISAGVAFGYDYALAEYKTLARPDTKLDVRPYVPFPVYLFDLSGKEPAFRAIDNEIKPRNEALEKNWHSPPTTLWLYEPSQRYAQRSRNSPVTEIVKMYYKTTGERKMFPRNEEENDSNEQENDSNEQENDRNEQENYRLLKVKPLIYTSTTQKQDSTPSKTELTSTKPIPTSPRLDSTSLKTDSITLKSEMTTKTSTTSPWPSTIMRIFKPKSMLMEWRPTKPNKNFFYRTLAASHGSKNIGHSYDPEMEIRTYHTLVHGKSERVPIRVWDATTKAKEPTETSEDENAYRNIMYF